MLLLNADSTNESLLEPESIDHTITSPPYNIGMEYEGYIDTIPYEEYLTFSKKWLTNVFKWTKPTGRLMCNIALDKSKGGKKPIASDLTQIAMDIGWKYRTMIIWDKGNVHSRTAWGSWKSSSAPNVLPPVEAILVMHKDEWKRDHTGTSDITSEEFIKYTYGMWTFKGSRKKGHVATFPRELPKRCLKLFTYKEDIILDPFMGSGTTLLECIEQKRECIGIEKFQKYFDLAKSNIDKVKL